MSIFGEAELLSELKPNRKFSPWTCFKKILYAEVNNMQIYSYVSRFTNPSI